MPRKAFDLLQQQIVATLRNSDESQPLRCHIRINVVGASQTYQLVNEPLPFLSTCTPGVQVDKERWTISIGARLMETILEVNFVGEWRK